MSGLHVGHERVLGVALAACLLAGCGVPPFNARPVVLRGPAPPQVVGKGSLPLCPQAGIWQAQALPRNMARLRLGITKLQAVTVLGDPARAETFSLNNGAAVEVLFYHTPDTICRVAATGEGLMPLVFQDDRLLGYGVSYYQSFIQPMMRPMAVPQPVNGAIGKEKGAGGDGAQGVPQPRVNMAPAESLAPAPAWSGRRVVEDLPTPPYGNGGRPPVPAAGNGYSNGMNTSRDGYIQTSMPYVPAELGRGEPLR